MTLFRGGLFPRLVALFPLVFPLYLMRGELLGLPVTLPEVLLAFMVLYFVIRERLWEANWWKKNYWNLLHRPVLLFLLAAAIGLWTAPDTLELMDGTLFDSKRQALGIFKGWIVAPIVYFFIARYYFSEKPGLIAWSLRALMVSGMALSFMAFQQVWTGEFITMDMRASGPFVSANYLSLYLGPIVVFSILAFLKKGNVYDRFFLLAGALVCGAALYFTESYASWIAVFATLFLAFILYIRTLSKKVRVAVGALILVSGLVLVISQLGTDKFDQFLDTTERSSTSVRLQVYDIAWTLMNENPIWGIGLGQFEPFYQLNAVRILGRPPFEWVMIHPHNIFFSIWLDMGIVGIFAFAFLLRWALYWLYIPDKKERQIVALMVVTILVHGLFDTPIFKNDLAFEFWMLMAILI